MSQDRADKAAIRRRVELEVMEGMRGEFGVVGLLSANKADAVAVAWVECAADRTVAGCQRDHGGGFY